MESVLTANGALVQGFEVLGYFLKSFCNTRAGAPARHRSSLTILRDYNEVSENKD